jgi:RimJ/RimL family protein N-acetyltransferase
MSSTPTPVELLETELAVIWSAGRRDPEAPPSVVIGDAGDALVLAVRDDVDEDTAGRLRQVAGSLPVPHVASAVGDLLRPTLGPLEVTVGPSYDAADPAEQPPPITGRLIRSDRPDPAVAGLRVPPTWEPDDWQYLLGGGYGPWAMVVEGDRVLSLCHSARFAPAGVEAGTWTAEDARGLGLAAAATAAWADACRVVPGQVFYSTSAANLSSQGVAARLKLPLLGRLWKFRPAAEGDGPHGAGLRVITRIP